uniref:Uncharacterized protein n=1 Tax=Heterorhabditis bacteriophora TaxID=37862 RepID=A0A1I7WUD4_HETBA
MLGEEDEGNIQPSSSIAKKVLKEKEDEIARLTDNEKIFNLKLKEIKNEAFKAGIIELELEKDRLRREYDLIIEVWEHFPIFLYLIKLSVYGTSVATQTEMLAMATSLYPQIDVVSAGMMTSTFIVDTSQTSSEEASRITKAHYSVYFYPNKTILLTDFLKFLILFNSLMNENSLILSMSSTFDIHR